MRKLSFRGSRPAGWNKSGTWKMLPCKKRRTTLTESPQHQGSQEEDDLDLQSAVKPESDQVKDLGSVSLSWSPSHGRAADLEVQVARIQLGMEDPSLSSRMLTDSTNVAVLEAVDVAISQGITLPSLESSQPVNTHIGKGKLQATSSRRGKKITLRPGSVTQEDRGDHPIPRELFSEKPSEEVKEEGEKANDDNPEYNFLEELDEPDAKDFCTDQAVRITKKDMNELMEESFETFQDEMGFSSMEDDGPEEEGRVAEPRPNFNTPQALRAAPDQAVSVWEWRKSSIWHPQQLLQNPQGQRSLVGYSRWGHRESAMTQDSSRPQLLFEEPLANLLNEQYHTMKELLEQLKMKKSSAKQQQEVERVKPQREKVHQTDSRPSTEEEAPAADAAERAGNLCSKLHRPPSSVQPQLVQTLFQPCNLMGAMQLIEDVSTQISVDSSPRKTVMKTAYRLPYLPKQVAWILATSKVFMYPELLPVCSLKAKNPQVKNFFTKAEDRPEAL